MIACELCGKDSRILWHRWYKYDNGETSKAQICAKCVDVHDMSLRGQSNGSV